MSSIPPYKKPSEDEHLLDFAKQTNSKYVMSTSTISSILSQLYYLITHFQSPVMQYSNQSYVDISNKFMSSQRKPITNIVRKLEDNIYALDSDKAPFESRIEILLNLGKILERMYTMTVDDFNHLLLKETQDLSKGVMIDEDYHRFMSVNNEVCLRSQLDCVTHLSNGNSFVYEIKSRAVAPMRYDLDNYHNYYDYNIDRIMGIHSSFEREYYDLIRGGFLKYYFQLKIGRMDGALIGYHNTQRHFGFEYISMKKIENSLFGTSFKADQMFVVLTKMLTTILNLIIEAVQTEDYDFFKLGKVN
jgi:hypothetical protein